MATNIAQERPLEDFNAALMMQKYVASALNESADLSALGIQVLPEDLLDIEFQIKQALAKQGMCVVVQTPTCVQCGNDGSDICWQMEDFTIQIVEHVVINRACNKEKVATAQDIAHYIENYVAGPQGACPYGMLCPKKIEVGEESDLVVVRCTFDTTALGQIPGSFEPVSSHVVVSPYAHQADVEKLSGDIIELSGSISAISEISAISVLTSDISALSADFQTLSTDLSSKVDKEAGKGLVAVDPENAGDGVALSALMMVNSGVGLYLSENSGKPYWRNEFDDESHWAASEEYVDKSHSYQRKWMLSSESWMPGVPLFVATDRAINHFAAEEEGYAVPMELSGEVVVTLPEYPEDDDPLELIGQVHLRDFVLFYTASGATSIVIDGQAWPVYGDDPGTETSGTYMVTMTELDRNHFGSGTFYTRKIKLEENS